VLEPWQSTEIAGWRKSMDDVAQFVFTDLPDSYAARTGRPRNVGVVGIAVFAKRAGDVYEYDAPPVANGMAREEARCRGSACGNPRAKAARESSVQRTEQPQRLGTGHGAREWSRVERTGLRARDAFAHAGHAVALRRFDNALVVDRRLSAPASAVLAPTRRARSRAASSPIRRRLIVQNEKGRPGSAGPSLLLRPCSGATPGTPLPSLVGPQQCASLQSSALSSTFSPAFCTSLPAPAIVLHAASMFIENMARIIR
jgi:hypothetical protein